jgi:hypothetical protein
MSIECDEKKIMLYPFGRIKKGSNWNNVKNQIRSSELKIVIHSGTIAEATEYYLEVLGERKDFFNYLIL